jgi:hypothetical protein
MTQQQFIEEIERLSVADRIDLLEAITRSLREDLGKHEDKASGNGAEFEQPMAQNSVEDKVLLVQRLYGILKFDGDPPTDEELKDVYADYLMEKYY